MAYKNDNDRIDNKLISDLWALSSDLPSASVCRARFVPEVRSPLTTGSDWDTLDPETRADLTHPGGHRRTQHGQVGGLNINNSIVNNIFV